MLTYETGDIPVEQALDAMLRVYSCIGETILLSGAMLKASCSTKRAHHGADNNWLAEIYEAAVVDMYRVGGVRKDRPMPKVSTENDELSIFWGDYSRGYVQLKTSGDHAQLVLSHHCQDTFQKWRRATQLTSDTTMLA